ncbi:MAG: sugar phosphate nucleotidyltransferase [Oceanipulchritudo sp.]
MKAVITAASPQHRNLPVQTLSDPKGEAVPLITLHLRDLEEAGISETAVIHHPDDGELYLSAAGTHGQRLTMIPQENPRGFGDAVWRARDFTGGEPFVLLVCDHLFLSRNPERTCVGQLIDVYEKLDSPVSAVQPTHESQVSRFGVVAGDPVSQHPGVYRVKEVREKPTPTEAELHMRVPGNRAGYYLGFFGIHVLTGEIFTLLEESRKKDGPLGLSPALNEMGGRGHLHAALLDGSRFDLEGEYGLLQAQLAMALSGPNRETVLAHLVKVLAETHSPCEPGPTRA